MVLVEAEPEASGGVVLCAVVGARRRGRLVKLPDAVYAGVVLCAEDGGDDEKEAFFFM